MNKDLQKLMSSLNEDEQEVMKAILSEISESGESKTLDTSYSQDYDDIPVDIETFIANPRYLGGSFIDDDTGKILIYKYWRDFLKILFDPNLGKFECGLSGSIGIGKSTIACIGLAYIFHKLLCLKDPAKYYNFVGSRVGIAIINLNLDASYGVGYAKLQAMLQNSPWFLENGTVRGNSNKTYYPNKDIDIVVGSKKDHFIGRDIFAAFLDKLDFMRGADAQADQNKALQLYTTIKRRMESRYMKLGVIPGMLFLVSSKRSSLDFLENYLKENKHKPYLDKFFDKYATKW